MLKVHAIAVRLSALLLLFAAASFAAEPRRISVYAPQAFYQVDILSRDGIDYVGLTDLLEPLGRLESKVDGKKLKLTFNGTEAEFQDGKRQYHVRSNKQELISNFILVGSRGYLPVAAIASFLPRLIDQAVNLHATAGRLFVGSSELHYAAELRRSPSRLVLTFTGPVNPSTVIEKNRVRLLFRREALVASGPETVSFSDPFVQGTTFSESPAGAELAVNVRQPATVSTADGGRTLTISAVPPPAAPAPAAQAAQAAQPAQPAAGTATSSQPHPARSQPFVILDAAHGGTETGAMLSPSLPEKAVNLAFARRLQKELESRGVLVVLTRVADNLLTSDQRAASANTSHTSLYVAIHSSGSGHGVRLYTSLLSGPEPATQPNPRAFLPWELAQAPYLNLSRASAAALAEACAAAGVPVRSSSAPLRPLNSVTLAAVAIEIAPSGTTVDELADPSYQQKVAAAIATGIVALRGKLGDTQ